MASPRPANHHYCLSGASLDTGNLGVTALGLSVVTGIAHCRKEWTPFIFDYQRKMRRRELDLGDAGHLAIVEIGASSSRRLYRPDTLGFMKIARRFGGRWHSGLEALTSSIAVLDASGGDSFTDLYGPRRFADVTTRKQLALDQRSKLILLPQTYGPFQADRSRRIASDLIRKSHSAWSRDPESHALLLELLGDEYDEKRHRQGVDVAFGLPTLRPREETLDRIEQCLESDLRPVIGVNVSGLLYNSDRRAATQYGLRADYRIVIHEFIRKLLTDANAKVILIPHVVTQMTAGQLDEETESDTVACHRVFEHLEGTAVGQLALLPNLWDPREVKWVIRQLDWFCGTRMHSAIAALSSAVPTAALSYSVKTRGVFKTCGVEECVVDPRALDTATTIDALWTCLQQRDSWGKHLDQTIPGVVNKATEQLEVIVSQMQQDR